MVKYRSNGNFELEISKENFFKLIEVTPGFDAKPGEEPVQFLRWVSYNVRTMRPGILENCLREHPLFASHYHIRNRQQPKVAAKFDYTKQEKKKRLGRNDEYAVWRYFNCAQNDRHKDKLTFCESNGVLGFNETNIKDMFQNVHQATTIRMRGEIFGNCSHVKGRCTSIFRITDQEKIMEMHGTTGKKEFVKMTPGNLYNQYHSGRAEENGGVVIQTRKSAYNYTSKKNKANVMNSNGLRKGDTSANVFTLAQYSVDDNDKSRLTQRELYGNRTKLVMSKKYMGCLRDFGYRAIPGNRGTTPFVAILCTARAIQIFNVAARHGTVVFHIDGTKSRVPWGVLLKEGDVCQMWIVSISATFVQQSHSNVDPNKVIRKNFSPRVISELHSPLTASKNIAEWLKIIFNGQREVCDTYETPVVVKTDCAKA
jgi:hypothetical protein